MSPCASWIDASVVLRLLTRQPKAQAQAAAGLMARADAGELRLRLCPLVVAEVVWVLTSAYDVPRAQVSDVLTSFLASGAPVATFDRDFDRLGVERLALDA